MPFTGWCPLWGGAFYEAAPFARWHLLTRWCLLWGDAFYKATPFTKWRLLYGHTFYKVTLFIKWRLLQSDTFYKVTPFTKWHLWPEWCLLWKLRLWPKWHLLTEVMPGTDVTHLADVMHCTDCACWLFLCQSWIYLSIVGEYYNQQIYLIYVFIKYLYKYRLAALWRLADGLAPPLSPSNRTPILDSTPYIRPI